jgi:hopanoid biosynthesis associated RND transporter like protein HpnN
MDQFEATLTNRLVAWGRRVDKHAKAVLGLISVLTISLLTFAAFNLGINSDNVSLVAEHLQARQNYLAFTRSFPNLENVILVVVDGETPELARHAATTLERSLNERSDLFRDVYLPGSGEFFQKHGLLYRDLDDLDEFAIQMSKIQPILASLERDPTIANLASLIEYALEEQQNAEAPLSELTMLLDRVGDATVEAYQEFPLAMSWEEILLRGSSIESVTRWVLVVDPVLDFDSLFAASKPMAEIRRLAIDAELDPNHGIRVRLTGNPVLNYEEMQGLLWDIGVGGVITFFFVMLVLWRALHSFRLVIAAIVTLLVGLVWTAAFAAFAVGALNLISLAFGILFIGLGVDFTIHLGMAYAEALQSDLEPGTAHPRALDFALGKVGSSLVICTITTATGFYVFIPTDNLGVAELGLIAGTGMIINFILTTTLFPSLLATVCRLDPTRDLAKSMRFENPWWDAFARRPGIVALVALGLFGLGAWQAAQIKFDANVVRMRDPETESVQVFNEMLVEAGRSSPWPMDAIAENLEHATLIARDLEKLEVVDLALSLTDYIPQDQEDKLEILEDIGFLLDVPGSKGEEAEAPSVKAQIAALASLRDGLRDPALEGDDRVLAASMRILRVRLDEFLIRAQDDVHLDDALARLEESLLGGLGDQLDRLRESTFLDPIGLDDLPSQLRKRMLTEDGRARIQIFPAEILIEEEAFTRFAREVQKVVPGATGLPMNMIAFGEATRDSFREALVYAIALISTFLFLLWRRPRPVLLVLAPLLLSNAVTVGIMATFGIPFNFANVVVIPLLLGIGVDSGIHLVHRAEAYARDANSESLLGSTTARAVFYSALTTTASFGTLALSSHRGVASLGVVLSIGMTLTVMSNLIVLPALLALGRKTKSI